MTVNLVLSCGGCDATAEVGPLRKRFHGFNGSDHGFGQAHVDNPEALAPEGWVMFDPYTYCTYCPTCWAGITAETVPLAGSQPSATNQER